MNSSAAVVRPRNSNLPSNPSSVTGASTSGASYHLEPSQWLCRVRCCKPGCRTKSTYQPATHLSFYIEELGDDPIFCSSCIADYPNIPTDQYRSVWLQPVDPRLQMYRIACRESKAFGVQILPIYITEKDEIIPPRSLFATPLWIPTRDEDNRRRPYACPECGKEFQKQSRYIRHVSLHINLYVCMHCQNPKGRAEDARNHLIRTCLPRHYANIDPARFDGHEDDLYHYSWHYRWRTNAELLADSRVNYQHHNLGPYPAIEYTSVHTQLTTPTAAQAQYYVDETGYAVYT